MLNINNRASEEWVVQRTTAIFLLTLLITCLCFTITYSINNFDHLAEFASTMRDNLATALNKSADKKLIFLELLGSPFIAVLAIFAVFATMYHGAIGVKIIIEDYVSIRMLRMVLIKLAFLFAYFVIGIATLAIISIHVQQYTHSQVIVKDKDASTNS